MRSIIVIAVAVAVVPVWAQEKKIERGDLPPAVQQAVAAQSKGATVKGFSTEMEHSQRTYEADMAVDGRSRDITMDATGRVLEVEEQVTLSALPAPVQQGLNAAARHGTILKVESLSKGGRLVAYEAVVRQGQRRREVQVGPDGRPLAHPE